MFAPVVDIKGNWGPMYELSLNTLRQAQVLGCDIKAAYVYPRSHRSCFVNHLPIPEVEAIEIPYEPASTGETVWLGLQNLPYKVPYVGIMFPDTAFGPQNVLAEAYSLVKTKEAVAICWRAPVNVVDRVMIDDEGRISYAKKHVDKIGYSRVRDIGWGVVMSSFERMISALYASGLDLTEMIVKLRPHAHVPENSFYYDLGDRYRYIAWQRSMTSPKREHFNHMKYLDKPLSKIV